MAAEKARQEGLDKAKEEAQKQAETSETADKSVVVQ